MIWRVCFGLALMLVAVGAVTYLVGRNRGKNQVKYLGAGVFLASVVTCFPVMLRGEHVGFALAMSISHSIRMFVVDTGVVDIAGELPVQTLGNLLVPYKVLVCGLYLLAPVFTLTVVLQYFSNSFERFRLRMKSRRNLFVFSELNTHSIEIASDMWNYARKEGQKVEIVFCCSDKKDSLNMDLEESARELNAILLPEEITHLRLRNQARFITYFLISDNEDENVEHTLQMVDNMTGASAWYTPARLNQRNVEIHCYATSAEAEILLDAKEKQELRVVLVDEVRDAVYEHLYQHPLYTNLHPHRDNGAKETLSLLIIGGGKAGTEFLKAAVWCGQMEAYNLEIHLIDLKGNLIRKKLEEECPELFSEAEGYKIHIHKGNIFSSRIRSYLDTLENISYCVSALGDDEDSIRAAVWMRRYFYSSRPQNQPFICAHIRSRRKRAAVWELCENTRNKTRMYYDIVPFGSSGMYYGSCSDAAFVSEYLGLGVQSHYFRLTGDSGEEERRYAVQNFYQKQCNRRSSIANGMHINSKLWEMGYGVLRVPKGRKERKLYTDCIRPVNFSKETAEKRAVFYNLEHERWMAYVRTEGWHLSTRGGSSLEDIRACYEGYCEEFKNQNYLMKMHPALVPIVSEDPKTATLQEVDDMIVEVNEEKGTGSYYPDYVQSDVELVDHIGEIVGGAWCGPKGIRIFGTLAMEGEYVICRLTDLLHYYGKIYEEEKDVITSEERRNLAEEIQRCCYGIIRTEKEEKYQEEVHRYLKNYRA